MRRQGSGAAATAVGCALAVTCAWPSDTFAQEIIVNDNFRTEQQGRLQSIELVEGEAYAADFTIPQAWLPIEMLGVRVVMVSDPSGTVPQSGYCGRYAIEVYEEPVGGGGSCTDSSGFFTFDYQPPGAEIYSMTRQFINDPLGFVVNADTANFQDLLFSTINNDPSLNVTIAPVILNNPKVRVAVRALDLACGAAQGQKFPLILTDDDGIQADNWVDGYFAGGITSACSTRMNAPQQGVGWNWYDWRSFEPFAGIGVSQGDFVIRLILDRNVVNPMPDAGMDAGADSGMDSGTDSGVDAGADLGMDTGIVVVDMAPDGTILDMRGGTEEDLGNSDSGAGVDLGGNGGDEDTGGSTGGGDELVLEAVSPSSAASTASTDVLVLGEGFELGLEVSLNARKIGVVEVTRERITANVPSGLEEGTYDVIVTNPDGESAILVGAFTVTGEGGGSGDAAGGSGANAGNGNGVDAGCGCRSTSAPAQGAPGSLLALALAGVVALRRRRARA